MDVLKVFALPKRRNYFIDKKYQSRFVLKFLAVLVTGSAVSGYVMLSLVNRDVENTFYSSHISLSSTGQILLPDMLKVNLGVLLAILLAVALITMYVSHKIASPLSRLGSMTEKIATGDLRGEFSLRDSDELKGLAGAFGEMNSRLKARYRELGNRAEDIDRAAENLLFQYASASVNPSEEKGDAEREKLGELIQKSESFGRSLSKFKLHP